MTEADHSVGMGEDVKRWFRWACGVAAALGWGSRLGLWILDMVRVLADSRADVKGGEMNDKRTLRRPD